MNLKQQLISISTITIMNEKEIEPAKPRSISKGISNSCLLLILTLKKGSGFLHSIKIYFFWITTLGLDFLVRFFCKPFIEIELKNYLSAKIELLSKLFCKK